MCKHSNIHCHKYASARMHVQMCECECVQKTKHANVKVCRQVDGWYSALRNVASESTFAVGKKFPPNLGFF